MEVKFNIKFLELYVCLCVCSQEVIMIVNVTCNIIIPCTILLYYTANNLPTHVVSFIAQRVKSSTGNHEVYTVYHLLIVGYKYQT